MFRTPYVPCPDSRHPACNIAHDRLALEVKCLRYMLRTLKAAGWLPYAVNTSDEPSVRVATESEALEEIFSVDESTLVVKNAELVHGIQIVLGNGIDLVPDYTVKHNDFDGFDALMTQVYEHFEQWEN